MSRQCLVQVLYLSLDHHCTQFLQFGLNPTFILGHITLVSFSRRGYSNWQQQMLALESGSVYGRRGMQVKGNWAEDKNNPYIMLHQIFHKQVPSCFQHYILLLPPHTLILFTVNFSLFPPSVSCFSWLYIVFLTRNMFCCATQHCLNIVTTQLNKTPQCVLSAPQTHTQTHSCIHSHTLEFPSSHLEINNLSFLNKNLCIYPVESNIILIYFLIPNYDQLQFSCHFLSHIYSFTVCHT